MGNSTDSQPPLSWGQIIMIELGVTVLVTAFAAADRSLAWAFSFHFNPYALLSLAAVGSDCAMFILITRARAKTDDIFWLGTHFAILALWALVEVFSRLGATSATTAFWIPLSSTLSYFMAATFFMFVLSYTHPSRSRHVGTFVVLLVATVGLSFLDLRTALFNDYSAFSIIPSPWGGASPTGPYYNLLTVWALGLYLIAIAMLAHLYLRTLNPRLKRQSSIFLAAVIIPVAIGTVTDAIMPALGIHVLPLAVVLTTISAAIITYGALRYRLLELTPAVIATNILDTINEAVIGIASDFSILYANLGSEHMLGYTGSQFAQLKFPQFLTGVWTENTLREALLAPLATKKVVEIDDIDLRTASGQILAAKLSITPVTAGNSSDGYLIVITDITKLAHATEIIEHEVEVRTRELEEAKATLVTSINSLELGFIITDAKAHVLRVNTVAHELLCHNRQHTAGECTLVTLGVMQKLFGSKLNIEHEINLCLKRQLPNEIKEVHFRNRDWRVYLSPMVVNRRSLGCAVLFQDITEELIIERSRDEFFSIASHELLTPLTTVKGYSSLILERYPKQLEDPELKNMVAAIYGSSNHLIDIVREFLYMSRLEHNQLSYHLEALHLAPVLEEVTGELTLSIKQKGIFIKLSPELTDQSQLPAVLVDKDRLKQIMFNLISNAVKFTDHGGITIAAQPKPSLIELTITDTGKGIPPKFQHLLFHKFQQATENMLTHDSTQGTGLGLYISRLLAEGMGGTLELTKSAPGKGTVFTLSLPIASPARLKRLAATAQSPTSTAVTQLSTTPSRDRSAE